jgi:hypothetical protein
MHVLGGFIWCDCMQSAASVAPQFFAQLKPFRCKSLKTIQIQQLKKNNTNRAKLARCMHRSPCSFHFGEFDEICLQATPPLAGRVAGGLVAEHWFAS